MEPCEKAAFIMAQVEMMRAERAVMEAENTERHGLGESPAHGPIEWRTFHDRWSTVLGYNALIEFLVHK